MIGMGVRDEQSVHPFNGGVQRLHTEVGCGVDHDMGGFRADVYTGAPPGVARVGGLAYRAGAADHGDAVGGAGSEEGQAEHGITISLGMVAR